MKRNSGTSNVGSENVIELTKALWAYKCSKIQSEHKSSFTTFTGITRSM